MKFEGQPVVPSEFVENMQEKIDSGREKLNLPITESELQERCSGNERCERALKDFLEYSINYATDVWNMKTKWSKQPDYMNTEEWQEGREKADRERSQLHNALIDSIAILSRSLIAAEENAEWVRELMSGTTLSRPHCGKFAIMLTYSRYVNAVGVIDKE